MRLDHIAYRVKDRYKTSKFFKDAFGYTIGTEFQVEFENRPTDTADWICIPHVDDREEEGTFHTPPEIFVSDGPVGSIVGDWVADRGNIGGVHHVAYQVNDVEAKMKEWKDAGYAEFLSDEPMTCPGLTQVFTKPSELTGVIYELISRKDRGFCEDNVKNLMLSTVE